MFLGGIKAAAHKKVASAGNKAYRFADKTGILYFAASTSIFVARRLINPENLRFYRRLELGVAQFDRAVLPVLIELLPNVTFKLDHLYLASNGSDAYSQFKNHILALGGKLLREVRHKERRLSVLRLGSPMRTVALHVEHVELGEPIPGKAEPNRLAHVAYLIVADDSERIFFAVLERLESALSGITLKSGSVKFIKRDLWGEPQQLVGMKIKATIRGENYEVEIRRVPI